MADSLDKKITEARRASDIHRQAVVGGAEDERLSLCEREADSAYEHVLAHNCRDGRELLEKMRYIFAEIRQLVEDSDDINRLLGVVFDDVSRNIGKT